MPFIMPEVNETNQPSVSPLENSPENLRATTAVWAKRRSRPEVFIVESLRFDDEQKGYFEGRILADVLKMCGKKPEYFYFRTASELEAIAQLFEKSESRYLHISCHGTANSLKTTLGEIRLVDFATMFAGKLNNRRLFFSACSVGSDLTAETIKATNRSIYSVVAPETVIPFTHAVALWTGFYVKIFDVSVDTMTDEAVELALLHQCKLFGTRLSWTFRTKDQWTNKTLFDPHHL